MTTGQSSGSSRTNEPSATDHQDAVVAAAFLRELGTKTGEARVPRRVAFTMGVYAERCAREAKDLRSVVPDSKPFGTLTKGKKWKHFANVLERRSGWHTKQGCSVGPLVRLPHPP